MHPRTFGKAFDKARAAAGRPDLHFHDLRHTGAVLAAQTGATLAELMARLGHSTPGAAMRYQHAAADRDRAIADKNGELKRFDAQMPPDSTALLWVQQPRTGIAMDDLAEVSTPSRAPLRLASDKD
jgi:Phage integrase family